jgi:predicted dienelactone hydrolase
MRLVPLIALFVPLYGVGVRQHVFGEAKVTVWYPSGATGGKPVRYHDYLKLAGYSGDLGQPLAELMSPEPTAVTEAMRAEALTTPFRALRDARPRGGRHPLLLWSVRHNTVAAQALLCEALAAMGYVVAVADPTTWKPRLPMEVQNGEDELNRHLGFLESVLVQLKTLADVDPERIGLLAWSYGGESALHLAARHSAIRYVVGLSASGLTSYPYRKAAAPVAKPVYWIEEPGRPEPKAERVTFLRLAGTRHGCFNLVESWLPARVGVKAVYNWSSLAPECAQAYQRLPALLKSLLP